jgi:hypothetical protein
VRRSAACEFAQQTSDVVRDGSRVGSRFEGDGRFSLRPPVARQNKRQGKLKVRKYGQKVAWRRWRRIGDVQAPRCSVAAVQGLEGVEHCGRAFERRMLISLKEEKESKGKVVRAVAWALSVSKISRRLMTRAGGGGGELCSD